MKMEIDNKVSRSISVVFVQFYLRYNLIFPLFRCMATYNVELTNDVNDAKENITLNQG